MAVPAMTLPHHVQLKKIAILTDLTSDAERPLRFAASLAQWYGADLIVAHACAPDSSMKVPPEPAQNPNADTQGETLTPKESYAPPVQSRTC